MRIESRSEARTRTEGMTMSEIMRIMRLPAVDMMRLQVENRRLQERLEASEAANALLTQELDEKDKLIGQLKRRARVIQAERDDARHERDDLRSRRDRAYAYAIATNRDARKRAKKIERAVFAAITAAWGVPAMVILFGKALEWIRYWIGR